ncbi:MAG: rod shape-determining protein MreC, partial [bacterium]
QSNPLYNSQIVNHLHSVEILGISDIISYSNEYFYISTLKDLKPLDTVLNEYNLLGIVEKVAPKISMVRYINSNSFQIPAKVIYNNQEIFGFIKTSSKVYFYPISSTSNIEIYSHVVTMGYFHIPPGIPIGKIYHNNEVMIFKDIKKTNQVIIIRRKR